MIFGNCSSTTMISLIEKMVLQLANKHHLLMWYDDVKSPKNVPSRALVILLKLKYFRTLWRCLIDWVHFFIIIYVNCDEKSSSNCLRVSTRVTKVCKQYFLSKCSLIDAEGHDNYFCKCDELTTTKKIRLFVQVQDQKIWTNSRKNTQYLHLYYTCYYNKSYLLIIST